MSLPNAPEPPGAPKPFSAEPNEHFLVSFDGTPIHYWLWTAAKPLADQPVVLIVHGAGEYAERYRPFAQFLNQAGYAVAAIDLRGFGQSGGPRAYVNRFSDYLEDLDAVAAQVLRTVGSKKLHLLGHSVGGLIAASAAALDRPAHLASLTLSSPCLALSFPVPPHLRAIGAVCSRLAPKTLFATRAISDLLTHDKEIAQAHRTDPRIVHSMSARLFFEMHRQMQHPERLARRIQVPTAVFQSGDDRVVDQKVSRLFFEALDRPDKRWMLYPNLFHEILNETSRAAVYQDFLSFLNSL